MPASTTHPQPVPYSALPAGQGLEWEDRADGIIIRVTRLREPRLHPLGGMILLFIVVVELLLLRLLRLSVLIAFPILLISGVLLYHYLSLYLPRFLPRWLQGKEIEHAREPVTLEVRGGLLFIHDPAKPVAFPKIWDYVLADFKDVTAVAEQVLLRKTTVGSLKLVKRDDCPVHQSGDVIRYCELSVLQRVAALLRPWIHQAQGQTPSWSPDFKAPPEFFHPSRFTARPQLRVATPIAAAAAPSQVADEPASSMPPPRLSIRVRASSRVGRNSDLGFAVGCLGAIVFCAAVLGHMAIGVAVLEFRAFGGRLPYSPWLPAIVAFSAFAVVVLSILVSKAFEQHPSPQNSTEEVCLEIRDDILHCHNPNGRPRDLTVPLSDIADLRGRAIHVASHKCGRLMAHLKNGKTIELITHQHVDDLKQIMTHLRKHISHGSSSK